MWGCSSYLRSPVLVSIRELSSRVPAEHGTGSSHQQVASDALVGVAYTHNMCATTIVLAATPWINELGMYDLFVRIGFFAFFFAGLTIPTISFGMSLHTHDAERYRDMARSQ
jgi:hypothetical protein